MDKISGSDHSKLTLVADLPAHEECCWNVAWSHDGKLLASCGTDKAINIWNLRSSDQKWVCRQTIDGVHERTIRCVSFNPLGNFLAAASFDSTVSIYEQLQTDFKQIAILEGHENEVKSVDWDCSGAFLATCSRDKTLWVWEMEADHEFECISVCSGHTQDVKVARWHPNREMIITGSYDDQMKVWEGNEDDWFCVTTIGKDDNTMHSDTVWDIAFSPDATRFASVSADKSVCIWKDEGNGKSWNRVQKIDGLDKRPLFSVSWSKSNVIAVAADNKIYILKQDTNGNYLVSFSVVAHETDVNCVRFNPSQPNMLASSGDDGHVKIWVLPQ